MNKLESQKLLYKSRRSASISKLIQFYRIIIIMLNQKYKI